MWLLGLVQARGGSARDGLLLLLLLLRLGWAEWALGSSLTPQWCAKLFGNPANGASKKQARGCMRWRPLALGGHCWATGCVDLGFLSFALQRPSASLAASPWLLKPATGVDASRLGSSACVNFGKPAWLVGLQSDRGPTAVRPLKRRKAWLAGSS